MVNFSLNTYQLQLLHILLLPQLLSHLMELLSHLMAHHQSQLTMHQNLHTGPRNLNHPMAHQNLLMLPLSRLIAQHLPSQHTVHPNPAMRLQSHLTHHLLLHHTAPQQPHPTALRLLLHTNLSLHSQLMDRKALIQAKMPILIMVDGSPLEIRMPHQQPSLPMEPKKPQL